ncbi:MAG: hypothetical protein AB1631_16660 [Acidobacteriota bacterium]
MRNDASKWLRLAIALAAMTLIGVMMACRESAKNQNAANTNTQAAPPPVTPVGTPIVDPADAKTMLTLSPFNHNRPEHKKQACVLCHKRTEERTAAPVFPGHDACDRCHLEILTPTAQTQSKLCVACHAPGAIELMPNTKFVDFTTRLKQFGIRATVKDRKGFSHRDHMDASKMPAGTNVATCDTCHKVSGPNATMPSHPQCYSCHTHQKGQKLGECEVCHASPEDSLKYSRTVGAAFSLYRFAHSTHTPTAIKASCDRCHRLIESPAAGNRSDILQISTARGQRHRSSCWTCHVQAKESVCTKCHVGGPPVSF